MSTGRLQKKMTNFYPHVQVNGVLADEMGLGKTVQAVALIAYRCVLPFHIFDRSLLCLVQVSTFCQQLFLWVNSAAVIFADADGTFAKRDRDRVW